MNAHGVSDSELRRRYAQVFDGVAEEYDRERPSYPPELIEAAVERGALTAGDPVVEVGCGTVLLTAGLVAKGLRVDAVDPGENMIQLAWRRVGEGAAVRFHHGRFEDVALPESAFAAVFSATAFDWVEPEIGWARAAGLLRPGGILRCSSTQMRSTSAPTGLARAACRAREGRSGYRRRLAGSSRRGDDRVRCLRSPEQHLRGVGWTGRHQLAVPEAATLFTDVQLDTVPVYTEITADRLNGHMRTTSLYARLDPDQRVQLEAENRLVAESAGGVVRSSESPCWSRPGGRSGRTYARAIDAGSTPSRRVMVTLASSVAVAVPRYTPLVGGTSA